MGERSFLMGDVTGHMGGSKYRLAGFSEQRDRRPLAGRQEHAPLCGEAGRSLNHFVGASRAMSQPLHHHGDCRLRRRNNRAVGCARISSWLSRQRTSGECSTILFRSIRTDTPERARRRRRV
jgi:hypothetical protein